MKIVNVLIFALILSGLTTCFSKKEDPLEKERKAFNESLEENTALNLYKGIKISLRSLPFNEELGNIDSTLAVLEKNQSEEKEIQRYSLLMLKKIAKIGEGEKKITIKEALLLAKVYSKLKKKLKKADEDDYPTLFEVLLYVDTMSQTEFEALIKELNWNSSKEHLLLAILLYGAAPLPESFQLYEISKLKIDELENTELKPAAVIVKGSVFMKNKWYYLAEEALGKGIQSLENKQIKFVYMDSLTIFANTKVDNYEAQIAELHSLSCLLRGYVRTKMKDDDKEELAIEDFEAFLEDAKIIGMDNELVWFAGLYVSLKKEDLEKAIVYLDKLENSNLMTDNEKGAIKEIKGYVSKRKPDKALNTVYDKLFIGKLVIRYIYNYYNQVDWYAKIKETEAGKQLFSLPEVISEEYEQFEEGMDTDKLKEKGKELINDIF